MSLRESILKSAALKTADVKLRNGTVTVTELDAMSRMLVLDFMNKIQEKQDSKEDKAAHYATLCLMVVSFGLREGNGEFVFDISKQEDKKALLKMGDESLRKLNDRIWTLSGFSQSEKK